MRNETSISRKCEIGAVEVRIVKEMGEPRAEQTNARQWEEVLAGVVSTWQGWEEDALRVTRP